EELRLAAFVAKGQSLDPTCVPARQALRMITIDAAKAWGMDSILGSLEQGKAADITVVDLDRPNTTPCYDIYSTLVYAAGVSNVKDVYVSGKRVVKEGKVTTVDETEVLTKAEEWARDIKSRQDA
ncbi:amidohydrolase family protein, partial [candidate division WOR-3 bacterium]|nr:amidohydrolase family protein [candidate division WOR-3 bacterium]